MPLQPPPIPKEPLNEKSVAWQNFFRSQRTVIAQKADASHTQGKVTGTANHFVTLNAAGEIQDAGDNPDLTHLQHTHANANQGGLITPTLAYQTNTLAANVHMTNPNIWYDGPTVTIGPGIWNVSGQVCVWMAGGPIVSAVLWDAANNSYGTAGAGAAGVTNSQWSLVISSVPPITVAAGANLTLRISAASTVGGATMSAALNWNPQGNTASYITAVRIG